MTNLQIIASEAIAADLYTEEEVKRYYEAGQCLPLHTFQQWKRMGYTVRKGEHARIETKLWKQRPKTKKEKEAEIKELGAEQQSLMKEWILVKSFLFNKDQVEKIA